MSKPGMHDTNKMPGMPTRTGTIISFESGSLTDEAVITYVRNKTVNNPPVRDFIRSENIIDTIDGSHYVLIVETNEPRRLVSEQVSVSASYDNYDVCRKHTNYFCRERICSPETLYSWIL